MLNRDAIKWIEWLESLDRFRWNGFYIRADFLLLNANFFFLSRQFVWIRVEYLETSNFYIPKININRQAFDDATKTIRADTNTLMRKIHTRVERAQSVLPLSSYQAKWVTSDHVLCAKKLGNITIKNIFISFFIHKHTPTSKVWKTLWTGYICGSSCFTAKEHHIQWPRIVQSTQVYRYVRSVSSKNTTNFSIHKFSFSVNTLYCYCIDTFKRKEKKLKIRRKKLTKFHTLTKYTSKQISRIHVNFFRYFESCFTKKIHIQNRKLFSNDFPFYFSLRLFQLIGFVLMPKTLN